MSTDSIPGEYPILPISPEIPQNDPSVPYTDRPVIPQDPSVGLTSEQTGLQPPVSGRLANGFFALGNQIARSAPHRLAHKATRLRTALFRAVTPECMGIMVRALVAKASTGNVQAIELALRYTLGPPESLDLIKEVATLRAVLVAGTLDGGE